MKNDTDHDFRRFLRSNAVAMEADEVLRAGPGALIGVGPAAEAALATMQINSIFDLASSRVFIAATALRAIQQDPTAVEARLNVIASDVAQMLPGVPVGELANQPISILNGIGESAAPMIAQALEITTVRDLALWPPYYAAKAILGAAFFPETAPGFDPEAPADLLPKSGVYPTERIFFKKLVIDVVPESPDGAQPIENAPPIDLAAALAAPVGFSRLATDALLTFSQSWFAQGLTLGQLLHSTSLAPGESTRVAVNDWSRRSRAAASEAISESELLSNTMSHSRALSEVTNATAREFQSGRSSTHVESTTEQGGGGFGLDLGPLAIGGSGGASTTTTDVVSASSSFGARDLAANYAQEINDRSQQNASSVRNRRASVVREVSQSEHEELSTRMLTNYNHMHALSIHYYEVVQAFRTTTQLERAERCLFVPVKLVDFRHPATVDRWRLVLASRALTERTRRQLTVEYGVVEIIPQTPRIRVGDVLVGNVGGISLSTAVPTRRALARTAVTPAGSPTSPDADVEGVNTPPTQESETTTPPAPAPFPSYTDYRRAPSNSPAALLATKGWDIAQLNRVGWATGRLLMQAGSDSVFVSDDALVVGLSLRDGQAARFVVRLHTGQEVTPAATTPTTFFFHSPVAITELESIAVQFTGQQDLRTTVQQELRTALVLQLNLSGTVMLLDVPIVLKLMSVPHEVVKFGDVRAARDLIEHLEANRLHYTQAILRALDAATVAALLARFTYRGLPLGQLVDPQPIAIMANFLVFKMNVATSGEPDDPRWAAEQKAWQNWLERHGLDRPAPRTEIIPIPSGGLFAEAVLGRYNSAEKTDLTRFWNWQDSPIPLSAPEIAPLQAGSRAQSDEIRPGQLSAPVLGIQAPTALPDTTGITAIINAVQNGNMFRDMSGLAQQAALAQAALQASAAGATAVGEQAGQNLKTVVENQTERMRIAAAVATGGASGLAGGGGATGNRPAKNVTEEGARLNFAHGLDASNASGGAASGGTGSSGSRIDTPSPQFGGSDERIPTSIERKLFEQQTGGVAANLANQVAAGTGGGTGSGSGQSRDLPASKKDQISKARKAIPTGPGLNIVDISSGFSVIRGRILIANFDVNSWGLKLECGPALKDVAAALNSSPDALIYIEGRASQTGSEAWNVELSETRANQVYNQLTSLGVDPNKIIGVFGLGSTDPLIDKPEKEEQLNRSVRLVYQIPLPQFVKTEPPTPTLTPSPTGSRKWAIRLVLSGTAGHLGIGGGGAIGELKNLETGEVKQGSFQGGGLGVGLQTPGVSPDFLGGDWTEFETDARYTFEDFDGAFARLTMAGVGIALIGYSVTYISFPTLGSNSISVGGWNMGALGADGSTNVGWWNVIGM